MNEFRTQPVNLAARMMTEVWRFRTRKTGDLLLGLELNPASRKLPLAWVLISGVHNLADADPQLFSLVCLRLEAGERPQQIAFDLQGQTGPELAAMICDAGLLLAGLNHVN